MWLAGRLWFLSKSEERRQGVSLRAGELTALSLDERSGLETGGGDVVKERSRGRRIVKVEIYPSPTSFLWIFRPDFGTVPGGRGWEPTADMEGGRLDVLRPTKESQRRWPT